VLIGFEILGQNNAIQKETDMTVKYKDLTLVIQRMQTVKTKVIPAVTGANGTFSNTLRQYLSNTPGKHEIKEIQKKTAILGTAHKLRNVLMSKYKTFNMRNNITCSTNRLCGLVVRVSGYRYRGPGFDPRRYQIF